MPGQGPGSATGVIFRWRCREREGRRQRLPRRRPSGGHFTKVPVRGALLWPWIVAVFHSGCMRTQGSHAWEVVASVPGEMALAAKPRNAGKDRAHSVLMHCEFGGFGSKRPVDFAVRLDFLLCMLSATVATARPNPCLFGSDPEASAPAARDTSRGKLRAVQKLDDKISGLEGVDGNLELGGYACSIRVAFPMITGLSTSDSR